VAEILDCDGTGAPLPSGTRIAAASLDHLFADFETQASDSCVLSQTLAYVLVEANVAQQIVKLGFRLDKLRVLFALGSEFAGIGSRAMKEREQVGVVASTVDALLANFIRPGGGVEGLKILFAARFLGDGIDFETHFGDAGIAPYRSFSSVYRKGTASLSLASRRAFALRRHALV
jgi:hypothetical protein